MLNKIILTFGLVFSQASLALLGFDDLPKFPILQKVGDFDPSSLQKFYNKFTDAEPDYAREDRMIAEIEDAVMDGDVEYLPLKGDKEVFSIYMEPDVDKPKGGVIILHSRGYHANWSSTIKPLRVGLAEKGWHTLSVQMPVLEKSAKYYDYVSVFPYSHERIDAALSFYKQRGVDNVILVSHGCGAHMSMSYFDKYGDEKINAYVGIGMGATDYKQKVIKRFPLDIMLKPVLDVYGENDFPGVIRLSESRQNLMDVAANTKSAQMVIKGADHYYKENGTAQVLTNIIDAWLSGLR
jgi:pimeloyl-ACP methyl ester carboxylesterase